MSSAWEDPLQFPTRTFDWPSELSNAIKKRFPGIKCTLPNFLLYKLIRKDKKRVGKHRILLEIVLVAKFSGAS